MVTGGVKISWDANPESDIKGYKVYWGSPTGYSFANSVDVGNVTSYTLAGTSISDTVAVTAYDNDYNTAADDPNTIINENQTNGHESWYSRSNIFSISGTVTALSGLSGVVMNGLPGNPTTDESGKYSVIVDSGWSGTVTPAKSGYTFSPEKRDYSNVTADQTSQNYTATLVNPPIIKLDKTKLSFGYVIGGQPVKAQTVLLSNTGGYVLSWTAVSNQSWLNITPTSGTGNGIIQVGINPSTATVGTQTGMITISDPNATNNPQTIIVALTVKTIGMGTPPIGSFDTPLEGTTGITGAIPVTGWAIDDIEVIKVEIWRDPVAGEGTNPLLIGNANFVEGARPDIEAYFPDYPFNYRAGWGYMMLTNFLPGQGNGIFKLYAYAYDKEGNQILLGTKTITCDNAHATSPFGTLDSPEQSGTASGAAFMNWGWVLTPQPKEIPKDGSTINVFVDGRRVGYLGVAPNAYNLYRKDVSDGFPSLKNTSGPVGYFVLDTTKYSNGIHTISWIAMDDYGAADGIGSRYFNIINTGTEALAGLKAISLGKTDSYESILNIPVSFERLKVKRGFNIKAELEVLQSDNSGTLQIDIKEIEWIEIDLGKSGGYRGYFVVEEELRSLPIGSTLDQLNGTFSWMPGPGFLGTYDLVFLKEDGSGIIKRIPVTVTIKPKFGKK